MATTGAYTATGIKFHRKRDTAGVSKVRRKFLCESEIFRRVLIHSTAAVLAPAVRCVMLKKARIKSHPSVLIVPWPCLQVQAIQWYHSSAR